MSKAMALLATTTVISSATALYLGWTLSAHRAHFGAPAATPAVSAPLATIEQLPAPAAAVSSQQSSSAHSDEVRPPSISSPPSLPPGLLSRVVNQSAASADIAYRRLKFQQRYSDAAMTLNLQPDEATRFFNLLAQQDHNNAQWEMSSEGQGKAAQRERQRRWDADKAEQAALLGDARMAEWNKYMNSLGARAEVRDLRIQLVDSDYPLRRDQYEPLVAALATEQVRHNSEREKLWRSRGSTSGLSPEQVIEYMNRRMDLIEESLTRRRRAAANILDGEQLKRYQDMLDLQRLRSQIEYDASATASVEAAQNNAGATR